MKRISKAVAITGMALSLVITGTGCLITRAEANEAVIDGGWMKVDDGTITNELQSIFDKAMDGMEGVVYTPVKLLETQVAAGVNYKFLCDSTVVYPGAETTRVIVTIYADLDGNAEVTDIADCTDSEDADSIGMPNPIVEVDSMDEAESITGFRLQAPKMIKGYKGRSISCIGDDLVQIIYGNEKSNLYIRKSSCDGNISGDYNEYRSIKMKTIKGKKVTMCGNKKKISTATWHSDGFSYSISTSKPMTEKQIKKLVEKIK